MNLVPFKLRRPAAIGLAAATALAAGMSLATGAIAQTTLTVARSVDADGGIDPHKTATASALQVTNLIFDTLLTTNSDASIHPGIAEAWTISDDGLVYTFDIRDGLVCHDGTTLDATGVKASIDRAIDPATANPMASLWGPIVSTAVEGSNVVLTLSAPYGSFQSFLANFQAPILCPTSIAADGTYTPIGTGPFKFVSWTRNDRLELEANPSYQNFNPMVENPGAPHIDKLTFLVIPEAVARVAALRTGAAQIIEASLEEAASLGSDPAFSLEVANLSGQLAFVGFSDDVPPFDNPEVRRAVGMALNRDNYAMIAFEGLSTVANCAVAPNLFSADESLCAGWGVTYDPEGAKAILAKAGYGPDKPLKVMFQVHKLQGWDSMHQLMQQDLAAVGIEATLETRDWPAFAEQIAGDNQRTDGVPVVWTSGMSGPDPDYLYFLWRSPGAQNAGVAAIDELLEKQRVTTGEERLAALQEAQKYLLENAYAIPLVSPGWTFLWASSANVKGLKTGYMVSLIFNDVTVE